MVSFEPLTVLWLVTDTEQREDRSLTSQGRLSSEPQGRQCLFMVTSARRLGGQQLNSPPGGSRYHFSFVPCDDKPRGVRSGLSGPQQMSRTYPVMLSVDPSLACVYNFALRSRDGDSIVVSSLSTFDYRAKILALLRITRLESLGVEQNSGLEDGPFSH